MIDYAEQIRLVTADIEALKKLKHDVDPASCMSVSVRRGVPQDNEDDDADRRPWRTMTFGATDGTTKDMHRLIDLLIADRVVSLKNWIRAGAEYAQKVCSADQESRAILKEFE